VNWLDKDSSILPRPTSVSWHGDVPTNHRQYSISLSPSVIHSVGPFISSLVGSGVYRYGEYKLLGPVGIYEGTEIKMVPQSKEDVFKAPNLSLVEKRRLMRFLLFAASEFENDQQLQGKQDQLFLTFLQETFSLNEEISRTIAYSLAYCYSADEPILPCLNRIRRCLRSAGHYGSSPFLVGSYGGLGDIAQGFCRIVAVCGNTCALNMNVTSAASVTDGDSPGTRYTVHLDKFPKPIHSRCIISSVDLLPDQFRDLAFTPTSNTSVDVSSPWAVVRAVAIVDQSLQFATTAQSEGDQAEPDSTERPPADSGVIVFPPKSLQSGSEATSVHAYIQGPGTMSTPAGKWLIYLAMPLAHPPTSSAEELLTPYLAETLSKCSSAEISPLFKAFYIQQASALRVPEGRSPSAVIVTPSHCPHIALSGDAAALAAEAVFKKAVEVLKKPDTEDEVPYSFWPPREKSEEPDEDEW